MGKNTNDTKYLSPNLPPTIQRFDVKETPKPLSKCNLFET
jgi:hypothetical protein